MSSNSKKEQEKKRIEEEFNKIQSDINDYDVSNYLAKPNDLPDLGEINLYDYESDIQTANSQSKKILESLVDLYLSDVPHLKEHPYIKNKMEEDAMVYAEAIFLSKMTRKNFISQLKQIDNGENSARMHEVVNQTIAQIRENAKFLANQRTELEKFYKTLRKDLGLNDEINTVDLDKKEINPNSKSNETDSIIIDNRKLNEMIKAALNKNKENNE